MKQPRKKVSPYLLIAILGAVLFLPLLGYVPLFDWDEINFAESAREMLITGEYGRVTINYQPFWEKPPLFIWMQALCMKVFGISEFAARLPNALCGIATLMVLFHYGRRYRDTSFGWFWVMVYVGTFLPHAYFKTGIIDPVFNLFMFLGVIHLAQWAKAAERNWQLKHAARAGLFIGLAVLTKGPVGLLLPGLTALGYMVAQRRWLLKPLPLLVAAMVLLAATFAWYGVETMRNGWWFLGEFLQYNLRLAGTEDSGHGGFLLYHFVVLLLGCFPASILLFFEPRKAPKPTEGQAPTLADMHTWCWILLGVVLVVFTVVQTKIVHYSSLAYFPITFLTTSTLYRWQELEVRLPKGLIAALAVGIGLIGGALVGATYYLSLPDGMAHLQSLIWQSDVAIEGNPWPWHYMLIGIMFALWAATSIWKMWRGELLGGAVRIFIITAVTVQLSYILLLPNIEPLSQGGMLAFLNEQRKEDVYINTLGFKSYAHFYYGEKQPEDIQSPAFVEVIEGHKAANQITRIPPRKFDELERWWHLEGNIDKPVVFIARATKANKIASENPQLTLVGQGGGYVFFKRTP